MQKANQMGLTSKRELMERKVTKAIGVLVTTIVTPPLLPSLRYCMLLPFQITRERPVSFQTPEEPLPVPGFTQNI